MPTLTTIINRTNRPQLAVHRNPLTGLIGIDLLRPTGAMPLIALTVSEAADLAAALTDLSDPAAPDTQVRRDAQRTSRAAAYAALPRSGSQRMRILRMLLALKGATDDEIVDTLSMNPNSVRPRRRELVLGGWLEDSGTTRPSHAAGHEDMIVWQVTAAGRQRWWAALHPPSGAERRTEPIR